MAEQSLYGYAGMIRKDMPGQTSFKTIGGQYLGHSKNEVKGAVMSESNKMYPDYYLTDIVVFRIGGQAVIEAIESELTNRPQNGTQE